MTTHSDSACARDVREIVEGMKWDSVYPKDYTRDYTDSVEIIIPMNYRSQTCKILCKCSDWFKEEDMYYPCVTQQD